MKRRYTKLFGSIWDDENFKQLNIEERYLWFSLLAWQGNNSIGIFDCNINQLSDKLKIPITNLKDDIETLTAANMIEFDPNNEVMWITNFLKWNKPSSIKNIISWKKTIMEVSPSPLIIKWFQKAKSILHAEQQNKKFEIQDNNQMITFFEDREPQKISTLQNKNSDLEKQITNLNKSLFLITQLESQFKRTYPMFDITSNGASDGAYDGASDVTFKQNVNHKLHDTKTQNPEPKNKKSFPQNTTKNKKQKDNIINELPLIPDGASDGAYDGAYDGTPDLIKNKELRIKKEEKRKLKQKKTEEPQNENNLSVVFADARNDSHIAKDENSPDKRKQQSGYKSKKQLNPVHARRKPTFPAIKAVEAWNTIATHYKLKKTRTKPSKMLNILLGRIKKVDRTLTDWKEYFALIVQAEYTRLGLPVGNERMVKWVASLSWALENKTNEKWVTGYFDYENQPIDRIDLLRALDEKDEKALEKLVPELEKDDYEDAFNRRLDWWIFVLSGGDKVKAVRQEKKLSIEEAKRLSKQIDAEIEAKERNKQQKDVKSVKNGGKYEKTGRNGKKAEEFTKKPASSL